MFGQFFYRRKRKDRWWRYLVLRDAFVAASEAGRPDAVHNRLGWAARRTGIPLSGPVCDFWGELVAVSAARSPVLDDRAVEALQANGAGLSPDLLPASAWLDLFRLAMGIGLFSVASSLREKALDRMIADGETPGADLAILTLACYADLERGQVNRAVHWLDQMSEAGCDQSRLSQAGWFLALMSGNREPVDGCPLRKASPEDMAFGKLVESRRVALVGPVASEVEQGAEIDGHDLVVKLGYRGGSHGCEPAMQGRRVDISYYNNTQAQSLSQTDFGDVFAVLRWGVCHNRKGSSCFKPAPANLRQLRSLQWLLPDTHFNAGPNAIIDLLRFSPAGIRVFNTDLMLSSGRFAGYREAGDEETDYTRSFIKTHDPILQYRVMHRLWSLGRIDGDNRFEEVMAMGLEGYLSELQKAYGATERALL